MASLASPLVLTKLRVPAARPRLIHRARLVERLTADGAAALVLLCAPAGYGKTTLFIDWAQSCLADGAAVAWYALDPGDDDPHAFGAYLIDSLIQAIGPLPELAQAAQLLRSSPGTELPAILPALVNAIDACGQPCLLILDDYHLINSPVIHSAVTFLLDHLPPNARVAIGSRAEPPLPLARLRAGGRLLEVRAASLRFTAAEAARFLNDVMRLDLPPEQVSALEVRTEGWVAGLQLAALAIQSPLSAAPSAPERRLAAFSGSHRYLVDYLLEEVFNGLPAPVQSFLLDTAILERMCAPLCAAVCGAEQSPLESGALLEQLEQANLFVIALDAADSGAAAAGGSTWYRYHHLFRDFLLARLQKTQPARIPALRRAAGDWLAAGGFLREAAAHAFQAQDWEYAAAFVEQHAFTLIIHAEMTTLHEWCAAFPEEVLRARPMLCILQCWPLVFRFRRENRAWVVARLDMVEQAIARLDDPQLAADLAEHAGVVRSFLSMAPDPTADPRAQLALAQAALGAYPAEAPGQFSGLLTAGYAHLALQDAAAAAGALEAARAAARRGGLYFGVVESSFQLARLRHSQGQLRRAAEICRQAQADVTRMYASTIMAASAETTAAEFPEQEMPALGCLDACLGSVLLEQDHLEEAEQHLLRGLERAGQRVHPFYLLVAYTALFRLREIQRRPAEALAYLDQLEAAWPDVSFCASGLRVVHGLRAAPAGSAAYAGALAAAAEWCQSFTPEMDAPLPGMGPFGAAEAYYLAGLAWIRAQIAIGGATSAGGNATEGGTSARSFLDRQLALAAANGLNQRVIELSLLAALAAAAEGDHARAVANLERALSLARPAGHLRVFDQDPALTRLLAAAAAAGIPDGAYIHKVLAAITAPPAAPVGPALIEPLSERELEVLRLMAGGATNQAIAGALFITVGTVKSHINHILGKLGARNRTEAVALARARQLI